MSFFRNIKDENMHKYSFPQAISLTESAADLPGAASLDHLDRSEFPREVPKNGIKGRGVEGWKRPLVVTNNARVLVNKTNVPTSWSAGPVGHGGDRCRQCRNAMLPSV
ncbi:hypothetical protein WA026_011213 [Henosepilachna vigintioctopunctata]|uniref:Uncharacterized protein n=1 Tax=Henosepilachna vigintioctopunctata TaxID=420089 RepID=A0AAW1TWY5_9CUCU